MSLVDLNIIISILEVRKLSLREKLAKALQLGQVLLPIPPSSQPCTPWVLTV